MGLLMGAHEAIANDEEAIEKESEKKKKADEGPPDCLVWVVWPLSVPFILACIIGYYPFVYGKKAFHKIKDMVKNEVAW